jgi:hypothetical protein
VELHTALSDNPELIAGIGMRSPRQFVAIGSGISLPTLGLDDLLPYLCVHGASSAWFRLKWIIDLAAVLSRSQTDYSSLYSLSTARGARRAAAQALLLGDAIKLFRMPEDFRRDLEFDRASRLLGRIALAQVRATEEPTTRTFGTASIHASQALLRPGWTFKGAELGRQVAEVLTRWSY